MRARRRSVTIAAEVAREISREAGRLERSQNWLVRHAWQIARADLAKMEPRKKGDPDGRPERAWVQ
jgi:uncharacterized small protein (TIGR04563 family)